MFKEAKEGDKFVCRNGVLAKYILTNSNNDSMFEYNDSLLMFFVNSSGNSVSCDKNLDIISKYVIN